MIRNQVIEKIKEAKSIIILPHIDADGDSLGSSMALGLALQRVGKEVKIYLEEEIPFIYQFLPGKELTQGYSWNAPFVDLAIAVDTGDIERLGQREKNFKNAKLTIEIDHHASNTEFAVINYVQPDKSSVGEMIYDLLKEMQIEIDEKIATCLYVSIAADTGGFRFSNTTSLTHSIVAELLKTGIQISDISQRIFDSMTLPKIRLVGEAIQTLELFEGGKIAFVTITEEALKKVDAKPEDSEGIVNLARNIDGVEVGVLFRYRKDGEIKASLRSNSYVDVADIAGLFGGGGHKRAAGCILKDSLAEAKRKLLKDIQEVI